MILISQALTVFQECLVFWLVNRSKEAERCVMAPVLWNDLHFARCWTRSKEIQIQSHGSPLRDFGPAIPFSQPIWTLVGKLLDWVLGGPGLSMYFGSYGYIHLDHCSYASLLIAEITIKYPDKVRTALDKPVLLGSKVVHFSGPRHHISR